MATKPSTIAPQASSNAAHSMGAILLGVVAVPVLSLLGIGAPFGGGEGP